MLWAFSWVKPASTRTLVELLRASTRSTRVCEVNGGHGAGLIHPFRTASSTGSPATSPRLVEPATTPASRARMVLTFAPGISLVPPRLTRLSSIGSSRSMAFPNRAAGPVVLRAWAASGKRRIQTDIDGIVPPLTCANVQSRVRRGPDVCNLS